MNQKALEDISERTGLSISIVKKLLDEGWTYYEGVICAPGFEDTRKQ